MNTEQGKILLPIARANEIKDASPVMLLGEATFHQFHGGTATNVPMKDHPWQRMVGEYKQIRGKDYQPLLIPPYYFGRMHAKCVKLFAS